MESATQPPSVAMNSIAVLPFVDMSAEQNQVYLADGIGTRPPMAGAPGR
jgi:TolB-like protein